MDSNEVALLDGMAANMGDGVFVISQRDERGAAQAVVLTRSDLVRLLAAS
jgi:hypothetical protein